MNSRDAETGGAASESGCSISTLLLYQGESQNLVHTQMWCSTPSVRALDGDGTTVYRAVQMVIRVRSASVRLPYNSYRKPYNTVMSLQALYAQNSQILPAN